MKMALWIEPSWQRLLPVFKAKAQVGGLREIVPQGVAPTVGQTLVQKGAVGLVVLQVQSE